MRWAAFLTRQLEPIVLVVVVSRLYRQGGRKATAWSLHCLHFAALSISLVRTPICFRRRTTLFGSELGCQIESYGPKLVGEPSAFGTGSFFAFVAALAIAELQAGIYPKIIPASLFVSSAICCYLSQSRSSLVAIAVLAVLFIVQRGGADQIFGSKLLHAGLFIAGIAAILSSDVNPRMSEGGVDGSVDGRITGIWQPLWEHMGNHPVALLLGVAPADWAPSVALRTFLAHNMIVQSGSTSPPGAVALCVALIATVCNAHRARTTPHASPSMTLHANLAINCTVWITTAGLVQDSFTAVTSSHLLMLAVGLHIGHMAMLKHRSPRLGQGTL